ncbi:ABC transporter substrate-binding protein [Chelativorans xinjiangense]|uniref:ABC transporter substrate-binding protein n=1 Tax=Chelativorans xinjiangense TaxID=2681485 RepID=UPI001357133C|nr:ABC transporter substrate-binding protein [Chelativorans xinjiangense]
MHGAAGVAGLTALGSSVEIIHAQGKKILRTRAYRDLENLDPAYMIGNVDIETQMPTMPRLARVVKEGDFFTWAPTEYMERLEQTDPTRYAFELKPGFMWTNGYGELTAEDVKYSYGRMIGSQYGTGFFNALDHVEVTGKYSGAIVLKQPEEAFAVNTIGGDPGCLVCKEATEAMGGKYTTEIPATCGPYVVKEWMPKQRIVFARNDEWPGPKPDFDEIQHIVITEAAAADLAYEAGEIDCTRIAAATLKRYTENPPPNSKITIAGYLNYGWLGMNTQHPKLSDIRVRKAIQHAIDTETAVAAGFGDAAMVSYGVVAPGVPGRRQEKGHSYDPDRARALLNEAGVSGLELDLKVMNMQERMNVSQVIQANLADVGIKVNVIPLETGTFWNQGRESKGDEWKDLQIYVTRFGTGLVAEASFEWFVKSQIGVWNWERWSDPEFDKLYESLRVETDDKKRAETAFRMQEIMEDTGAYVWLWHEPEAFIHPDDIEISITPTGNMDLRRFRTL